MASDKLTDNKEGFRDIPGYEGLYQVSNFGRIKSLEKKFVNYKGNTCIRKERILTNSPNKHGYLRVGLSKNGVMKTQRVHQLVAMAFLSYPKGKTKMVVDHINNNRLDNTIENIQVITFRENTSKDKKNGTSKYVGVNWDKGRGKWLVRIYIKGRGINLGRYKNEKIAAAVYTYELEKLNEGEGYGA